VGAASPLFHVSSAIHSMSMRNLCRTMLSRAFCIRNGRTRNAHTVILCNHAFLSVSLSSANKLHNACRTSCVCVCLCVCVCVCVCVLVHVCAPIQVRTRFLLHTDNTLTHTRMHTHSLSPIHSPVLTFRVVTNHASCCPLYAPTAVAVLAACWQTGSA